MTDDGALATGGISGITEDTPGHAGAPEEAGSVDGVSAFGGEPETGEEATLVNGDAAPAQTTTADMADEREREEGLVSGIGGGVTGTSDL